MMNDESRVKSFKKAIDDQVTENSNVLEIDMIV